MTQSSTDRVTHTPGPWAVHRHPTEPGAFTVIDQHDEFVAWSRDLLKPDAECEANARLIAAAPELLATAKTLMDAFERDGVDADWAALLPPLDAAIDKAEGR